MIRESSHDSLATIDQDLQALKDLNQRFDEERREKETEAKMGSIYDLVEQISGGKRSPELIKFTFNDQELTLEITEFNKAQERTSGFKNHARIEIRDKKSNRVLHHISVSNTHDSDKWQARYLDFDYSKDANGSYKWRHPSTEANYFDAKLVYRELPELKAVEEMLIAALEQKRSRK